VAGGPYYCAQGLPGNALRCMGWAFSTPDAAALAAAAQAFAQRGRIDPLSNLRTRHVYVFSGTNDLVVNQPAVNATAAFFSRAGIPPANLTYIKNVPAGHALLVPNFGNACFQNAPPFISHCIVDKKPYDQVGAMFAWIYGAVAPPAAALSGTVRAFNQREFAAASSGMADEGHVYVPARCSAGGCRIHIAFHACAQSAQFVDDDFYARTTYNAWADSNDIVVLYPQVNATFFPVNFEGCWDWWGYTGQDYAFKEGVQMRAVHAMVERLRDPVVTTPNH
jgi:hypothetical protein